MTHPPPPLWHTTSATRPPPAPFQSIFAFDDGLDIQVVCWPRDALGADQDPGDEDADSVAFRLRSWLEVRLAFQELLVDDPWLDAPLAAVEQTAVNRVDALRDDELLDLDALLNRDRDVTRQIVSQENKNE